MVLTPVEVLGAVLLVIGVVGLGATAVDFVRNRGADESDENT